MADEGWDSDTALIPGVGVTNKNANSGTGGGSSASGGSKGGEAGTGQMGGRDAKRLHSCFKCGDENHFSKDCPFGGGGGKGGGKCYKCHEYGHMSRDCNHPKSKKDGDRDRDRPSSRKEKEGEHYYSRTPPLPQSKKDGDCQTSSNCSIDNEWISLEHSWNSQHKATGHWIKMTTDFLSFLEKGHLSDVKIISNDGKEFLAHKLILSTRSEVFEAMFREEDETPESGSEAESKPKSGEVKLDDMSSKAVKFLLQFLYSSEMLPVTIAADEEESKSSEGEGENESEKEKENATFQEVMHLASKYGLTELATHLEDNIKHLCDAKNSVFFLKLCKLYSLQKGKDVVLDFMMKNQPDVLKELAFSHV